MSEPNEVAKKLMDIIPNSMSWMRTSMRSTLKQELTVPQFRILANIYRGNNLACDIAKHQGISQAATSKMIDLLVTKKLVQRVSNAEDRRHYHLSLTEEGDAFYKKSRRVAQINLKEQISRLDSREQAELEKGLLILEKLFLDIQDNEK